MSFQIAHQPQITFSIVTWEGVISFGRLKKAIAELGRIPDTRLVLWDFRDATEVTVTIDHVQSLARLAREESSRRPVNAKTAVLVSSDFLFGIARQAHAFAMMMSPNPPIEIFRDPLGALAWLGVAEKDLRINGAGR